jgi:hypothetical protein
MVGKFYAMINFTAYQDVECVYPMSGQYGRAPRALYYALLLFVVVFRRQNWLTAGAAAYCLTFGGSAAIHALILAPILSLGTTSVPAGTVQLPDFTKIIVHALATDLDSDATLAIVGTGFLIVIPMAIWSAQFRHSGAVPILVLWILLMFVGMVCCITNLYAINGSPTGPLRQYRFCSLDYNDTLPYSANPLNVINNSWNDTVWSYFNNGDASIPSCIYPCLSATELLRQPGDAKVVSFVDIHPGSPLYWGIDVVSAIIYGCVPLSMLFSFAILFLRLRGHKPIVWDFDLIETSGWKAKLPHFMYWAISIYSKILTPFVFVVFLGWVEWIIFYDLQSEEMQLVGQWAPLVGAGLVFVAAVVGRYWPRFERKVRAFWLRRATVKRYHIDESAWGSMKYVWDGSEEYVRSTWSQVRLTYLQGVDDD